MTILVGLAVATLLIMGWITGNRFVCVFLSLPVVGVAILALATHAPATPVAVCVGILLAIWAPLFAGRAILRADARHLASKRLAAGFSLSGKVPPPPASLRISGPPSAL